MKTTTRTSNINSFQNRNEKSGFAYLVNTIHSKTGLDVSYYRDNFMKRRIKLKMSEKKIKSFDEYASKIKTSKDDLEELMDFITVNYTRFYRDNDVFDHYNDIIMPELYRRKNIIRILSAGCSTGEEPYTLAILAKEYTEKNNIKKQLSIHALDVDQNVLDKAIKGKYTKDSVQSLDKKLLAKYFETDGRIFSVNDEIKKMVRYGIHDITRPMPQRHYDIVFCRNVFIYFNNEAKIQILENFYNALNKEGYLVIGKTEMLPPDMRDIYSCTSNRLKIFRKK